MRSAAKAEAIARAALPVVSFDSDPTSSARARFQVGLARACYRVDPGLQQLVEFDPGSTPPDHVFVPLRPRAPLNLDSAAAVAPMAQDVPLERHAFVLHVEVELTESHPVPVVYDRGGRWRAHPPSKRKRMRSWLRATDAEKLRYAPLAGLEHVPWWARHPDRGRVSREHLGLAVVMQELLVYRQRGADVADLLKRHSDEWTDRVARRLTR